MGEGRGELIELSLVIVGDGTSLSLRKMSLQDCRWSLLAPGLAVKVILVPLQL